MITALLSQYKTLYILVIIISDENEVNRLKNEDNQVQRSNSKGSPV